MWKLLPGESYHQFRHLFLLAKFLLCKCLSCVNDYIEDIAPLAEIYSTKYFCNTKVAGLGEIFVQQKMSHTVSHVRVCTMHVTCLCVCVHACVPATVCMSVI